MQRFLEALQSADPAEGEPFLLRQPIRVGQVFEERRSVPVEIVLVDINACCIFSSYRRTPLPERPIP